MRMPEWHVWTLRATSAIHETAAESPQSQLPDDIISAVDQRRKGHLFPTMIHSVCERAVMIMRRADERAVAMHA